jgi:hypothetical protein
MDKSVERVLAYIHHTEQYKAEGLEDMATLKLSWVWVYFKSLFKEDPIKFWQSRHPTKRLNSKRSCYDPVMQDEEDGQIIVSTVYITISWGRLIHFW